jgi:hypothetical protein
MMAHGALVAERLSPIAALFHAAVAALFRFLRLRPVGHGAGDADASGNAAIEE